MLNYSKYKKNLSYIEGSRGLLSGEDPPYEFSNYSQLSCFGPFHQTALPSPIH